MNPRTKERCAERLLAEPKLQHDEAQAALAATFSVTAMEAPSARLDEASLALFGAAGLDLPGQAHALADVLTNNLCLCPERRDHRALLIDHALTCRAAHPLQIAVIGHELGRRAGLKTFVGSCGGEPWTVLRGDADLALVGPATVSGRPEANEVRRRCPHQVAQAVLRAISRAAPPDAAKRAERLLRSVPVREY
ncbi:MAG: hypothetical protein ACOYD4_10340 [Solirubrobacterales bacterium]